MIVESIAHYRVTSKLREGGMGAVYRARGAKLDPETFAQDAGRVARFTREAPILTDSTRQIADALEAARYVS